MKARAAIFDAVKQHSAPYVIAVYKDGSVKRLDSSQGNL
jgi:hypothetical protein